MMRLPKMWSIRRRLITGISSKISLRGLLVIPFVVQIFATVGIVGYLSFRNGQKAVDYLAYRLIVEIVNRIEENITHYLEIPFIVGRDIQDAVALGLLDVEDLSGWELYFWRKAKFFESIDIISIGNEQGEYRSTSCGDTSGFSTRSLTSSLPRSRYRTFLLSRLYCRHLCRYVMPS